MAVKRRATKRTKKTTTKKEETRDTQDRDTRGGDDRGYDNRGGDGRGRSYGNDGGYGKRDSGKPERFRMTGLWPTKNNQNLFTGTMKEAQDIERLRDLCEKVLKGTGKLVLFLYVNDRKRNERDPEFTIYGDEGKDQQGGNRGGGGYGRSNYGDDNRGRDRYIGRDDRKDPNNSF